MTKKREFKSPVEKEIIDGVQAKFKGRKPKTIFKFTGLLIDMIEFFGENQKLISPDLYIYLTNDVTSRKLARALSKEDTEVGATPRLREILGSYAFEEEWEGKNEALGERRNLRKENIMAKRVENAFEKNLRKIITPGIKIVENTRWIQRSAIEEDIEIIRKIKPLENVIEPLPWDVINNRLKKNPDILQIVLATSPHFDKPILSGFFFLYPISADCEQLIMDQTIQKSDEIPLKHICRKFEDSAAIYISIVYSLDHKLCKHALLTRLNMLLASIVNRLPSIKTIFSRPMTEDGDRLCDTYNFQKIGSRSRIYYQKALELSPKFKR